MIIRVNQSKNVTNSLRYVIDEKKEAKVIGGNLNCLTTGNVSEIIKEMEKRTKMWKGWPKKLTLEMPKETKREQRVKKCIHLSVSFSPRDQLTEKEMARIGDEVVNRLGWGAGQYVIVSHGKGRLKEEQNHQHQHIIINKVKEDGKLLKLGKAIYHAMRVRRELEREYGLEEVPGWDEYGFSGGGGLYRKWVESARTVSIKKFEIQNHILDNLEQATQTGKTEIVEFLNRLETDWLEIKYWNQDNYDGEGYKLYQVADRIREGEHFGISYGVYYEAKHEIMGFKGKRIGRLGTLEGIKGYLAGEEKFRNLRIPIALKDYRNNHQGEIVHEKQKTGRVEIPVMSDYLSYLNEQNKRLLKELQKEAEEKVKEKEKEREEKINREREELRKKEMEKQKENQVIRRNKEVRNQLGER